MVVTGAAHYSDTAIYAHNSMTPLCLLTGTTARPGHDDWVFGNCFVAGGAAVVTCGRDKKLAYYRLPDSVRRKAMADAYSANGSYSVDDVIP